MEEIVEKSSLEVLAARIAEWFPELEGRALAVSEVEPFSKTNVPTLPLAIIALVREIASTGTSSNSTVILTQNVSIEFMLATERYRTGSGGETPFFAAYDYETIRDRLLSNIRQIGGYQYISLDVESDEFGVTLSFRFNREVKWCEPYPDQDPCEPNVWREGQPAKISFNILAPSRPECPVTLGCDEPKEC